MKHDVHGKINRDILKFVFGYELSEEKVNYYAQIKEETYRNLVLSDHGLKELAPGAIEYLSFLKKTIYPEP